MKRILMWIGIAVLLLITLAFITEWILIGKHTGRLDALVESIRAAGEPTTWIDLDPIECDPADNGAHGIKLFFDVVGSRTSSGNFQENEDLSELVQKIHSGDPGPDFTGQEEVDREIEKCRKELLEFMRAHADEISALEKELAKPRFDFDNEYENYLWMNMNHLTVIRFIVKLFSAASLSAMDAGLNEEAMYYWRLSMQSGEALREEKALVATLVRVAALGISLSNLETLLQDGEWSIDELQLMADQLPADHFQPDHRTALMSERVMALGILNPGTQSRDEFLRKMGVPVFGKMYLSSHFFKQDIAAMLSLYERMLKEIDGNPPHVWLKSGWWEKECEALPPYCFLSRMLLPALDRITLDYVKKQTALRMMKLALRLQIDKAKGAPYPDALPSGGEDVMMTDPFSGKPFLYAKTAAGFSLESAASKEPWIDASQPGFISTFLLLVDK